MRLLSLTLSGQYKGLKDQTFDFSRTKGDVVALIGLNGSGKSQLLELVAETFAYLERWQRPDFTNLKALPFSVELDYEIRTYRGKDEDSQYRVSINLKGCVTCQLFTKGEGWFDWEKEIPLPGNIIGYASGLNENLQRSFMKNAVQYFEVQRVRSKRRKELARKIDEVEHAEINRGYANRYPHIFSAATGEAFEQDGYLVLGESDTPPSQAVYLDYDNTGLLLICLAMLPMQAVGSLLDEVTFKYPTKAVLQYDLRSGATEEDAIRDIRMLVSIAGHDGFKGIGKRTTDQQYELYELDFLAGQVSLDLTDQNVVARLQERNYNDPLVLFRRLHKLQQLGVKNWPYAARKMLLKDDFFSTVKKPLKTKLPLTVAQLVLSDGEGREVNFDDLSDGEAQLTQILSAAHIFGKDQTLFLLDEPETHLNPSWRTYFHSHLIRALDDQDGGRGQSQIFLSTHSPFMISSLKQEDVFFFGRDENGLISMEPMGSQTYGASFEVLIKNHYGLRSLISQTVVEAVKEQLPKEGDLESKAKAREWIENNLGDSMEKAYLLRKLKS